MKIHLSTSSVVGFTDNHAAHHAGGVEGIVEAAGAIFSIVKGWRQANDLMFLTMPDPEEMILRAFFHVTRSDVQSLYTHCGYL